MSPKRPRNRGASSRPRNRRPQGAAFGLGGDEPIPLRPDQRLEDDEPGLHGEVDRLLREEAPVSLLAYASSLASALEHHDPFNPPTKDMPDLAGLVAMFREMGARPTDALLPILTRFLGDELLIRQVDAEVAGRKHPLPSWLMHLDEFRPTTALAVGHALRDGENLFLGMETPIGDLTIALYIDHNFGTVVKDGYINPDSVAHLHEYVRMHADSEVGVIIDEPTLADARAMAEQAIASGRFLYPPMETDSWPASQPLVEWMLRSMPGGGTGYPVPTGTEDWGELLDALAAARAPMGFDAREHSIDRDIAKMLMTFAADHLGGDPLRVSPVTVEIMLRDFFLRKVHADAQLHRRVPTVLRHMIEFAHAERQIPRELTEDTLAAVADFAPDYLEMFPSGIASADAYIEQFSADDVDAFEKAHLAAAVGGRAQLETLRTDPLPNAGLSLDGLPTDIHTRVTTVAAIADATAAELFGDEVRTAVDRIIERVAASDPAIFRRASKDERTAAALIWIAANANDAFGALTVQEFMAHLGLSGSPTQRAETMLRALDVTAWTSWSRDPVLGDAALLTSAARRRIKEEWERLQHGQ